MSNTNNLNRIYTRNMLRGFIEGRNGTVFSSVVNQYIRNTKNKKNIELLSEIYNVLRKQYRNEYYYKNTLLNKLLLGVHSVNTTTALTEVAIAKSKADFVLINGKAVVYEIKTELDNLDRLCSQIDDYYKVFDYVVVVTYEENVVQLKKLLEMINKPVGISVLRKNDRLSIIQKPQKYTDNLNKDAMFRILRKGEYENILLWKFGYLPRVTQFRYYSECKDLFGQIEMGELYPLFLKSLKTRARVEKKSFEKIPYELRFLAYFSNMTSDDYCKLNKFLECQYGGL